MIKDLPTEQRNPNSMRIDSVPTEELVNIFNAADHRVADAVATQKTAIARAIDEASARYNQGGRLIYCGAGTSGRLGVLDAVELVPTYGISQDRAIGLIAGGQSAMYAAVEGAEDDPSLAQQDLTKLNLNQNDIVIGIAASGRTPYVIGALQTAHQVGALSIAVSCVSSSAISAYADIPIEAVVGPEVVTGSTRMGAGSAQKMILNTISSGVMIKAGKVYQNLMVDVLPTNQKLVDRAIRIIAATTGVDENVAQAALAHAHNVVPTAIVMAQTGLDEAKAKALLAQHHGVISQVLSDWQAQL
ncbi:N-acetylmuramic acid 6-phosphate etherase [Lacticaseibacillus jixiensis]|uniref:N-acetylmuramic acid 6-phosphate etherase n=1 Tax=Lacticaseibacillus jixiensis TaxID=3231926 RepID=UPI0036F37A69